MGKMKAKSKALLVGLLAVVMAACGFLGFGLRSGNNTSAADETAWLSANAQSTAVGSSGAVRIAGAAIIVNSTNILELPDRTATFQMKVNKSAAWSGMSFLNGLEAKDADGNTINAWNNVTWPGVSKGVDQLPHLIFQDGSGQIYGNNTSDLYGQPASGITSKVPNWSEALVSVELHIGTGTDGDVSYMKLNNVQVTSQNDSSSALSFMTTADFPNGCYLGMHLNMDGGAVSESYFTEYGNPLVPIFSSAFKSTIKLYEGLPADGLFFTASHLADLEDVTVKFNGETVDPQYYTIKDGAAKYPSSKRIEISQAFWSSTTFPRVSYFTVESAGGKAVILLDIQTVIPPEWTSESYLELDAIADVNFDFTYSAAEAPTTETIKLYSGIYDSVIDMENALVPTEDYVLTPNGDSAYTLTINASYLEKVLTDYYGRSFVMQIGEESISARLYLKPQTDGWTLRPIDGTATEDEYYVTANLVRFNDPNLVPRVYYNQAMDVTKPIVIEADFSTNAFDNMASWVMLQVMDSYRTMDYFSDKTLSDAQLAAIFFGGRSDLQKLGGFTIPDGESTNANYTKTTMKKVVIEIYFGVTAEESYFRVNGVSCGSPSAIQSDFKDGKAYIGWFIPRSAEGTVFKVNSHLNPVVVTAPIQDSAYTMDISSASDFTVTLQNAGASLTVRNDKGYTLVAEQDYTYSQETQQLTIKAAYFSALDFAKGTTISVWDEASGTGTQFSMTYTASEMQSSVLSFSSLGALTDAVFDLPSTVTGIKSIDSNGVVLDETLYSFADGKLTIKKDAIADAKGATEFIVTSEDGKFYPLYVYVDSFENGGSKQDGNGTFETDGRNTVIKGDLSYTLMQAINFENGATFKVDFKSIPGYYHGGLNATATGKVELHFYDPFSGYTLVYRLFTNYEDDQANQINTALYESYEIFDAEGNTVLVESTRAIDVTRSENSKATGVHSIKLVLDNGSLKITVDNARSSQISTRDLGSFNLSASVCTVVTPAGTEANPMELGIAYLAGIQDIEYSEIVIDKDTPVDPDNPDNPDDPDEPGEGCSSCNSGSAMAGVGILLAGLAIGIFKRR